MQRAKVSRIALTIRHVKATKSRMTIKTQSTIRLGLGLRWYERRRRRKRLQSAQARRVGKERFAST